MKGVDERELQETRQEVSSVGPRVRRNDCFDTDISHELFSSMIAAQPC
jgi:hypothetical protein